MTVLGLFGLLTVPVAALNAAEDRQIVAATVDGWPIDAQQVDREIQRALGDRTIDPAVRDKLRRETLQQLIDRRLVHQYLMSSAAKASQAERDRAVQRLRKWAAEQEISWDQYLHSRGLDEPQLREQLAWEISWSRFLEQHATDDNLQRYFDQHRDQFDGRKVRTAHILLRIEPADDQRQRNEKTSRAEQLRQQIDDGQLDFAAAAAQFSESPTAADGGRIGWIGRHGPMPEPFSAAAFALEPGQVSSPVLTSFGVHLIQCIEIQPGDKTWQQVRGDLYQAVSRYLYRWAADRQRNRATIEIDNSFR
jgi:parvulin-like peptidyl-prolyl isomerase